MNQVRFRFYEELNDYLPEGKRKVWFEYFFLDVISLKDAFKLLEIPSAEIDLLV